MKKVSFDFDDTLSFGSTQDYAKFLIDHDIEIHIVTSRYEDPSKYSFECNHDDLFEVSKKLGIPNEHIHFTNFSPKCYFFISNTDFVWHLDDNFEEICSINAYTDTLGVWSLDGNYKHSCNTLLGLNSE
jgi:hypothetical protein